MPLYAIACLALLLAVLPATCRAEIPRPEHPRPDFQREDWLNLNGTWEFEIDAEADGEKRGLATGKTLRQNITVPFAPESKLSGIGHTDFIKDVWYRRSFEVPRKMQGRNILLHFGAVDWHARVWLNGRLVGAHKGGYTPFTFDVTRFLRPGPNELVVHAHDDTRSGKQAVGKQAQTLNSEGCSYTRTTGIWQTVWLEAVGDAYLRSLSITPDLDAGRAHVQAWVAGPSEGTTVRLRAYAGKTLVGEETVRANWRGTLAVVNLSTVKAWAPGRPFLYDLTVEVIRGGKPIDVVRSYFGLRKITIEGNRFLINDRPVFQRLVLDQGFYPDGVYTAPTDGDLKKDVVLSMAAGFNGARLHQKVFEPRLLYWADKLGYLVWGEYPSWGVDVTNQQAVAQVAHEWREVIERDRNHPSLIGWCPLNETPAGEGIAAAQTIVALTQTMDPTRPFLDTSGYVHLYPGTDIYDCHDYNQDPTSFRARYATFGETGTRAWSNNLRDPRSAYRGQPYFVSEYGGIRLKTDRSVGDAGWGYGQADLKEYIARYKGLTDALLDNPNMFAFCYTQLTDVEQEQNGIFFYDRSPKHDVKLIRDINVRKAAYETQGPRIQRIDWAPVVPTSRETPQVWRYTFDEPDAGWTDPAFVDVSWKEGPGGFGTEGTIGAVVRTTWNTPDIWLRRKVTVDTVEGDVAALDIHHDEDVEVYLNGQRVAAFTEFEQDYVLRVLTEPLKRALVMGENTLAVHCRQTTGGQFIDVGILLGRKLK